MSLGTPKSRRDKLLPPIPPPPESDNGDLRGSSYKLEHSLQLTPEKAKAKSQASRYDDDQSPPQPTLLTQPRYTTYTNLSPSPSPSTIKAYRHHDPYILNTNSRSPHISPYGNQGGFGSTSTVTALAKSTTTLTLQPPSPTTSTNTTISTRSTRSKNTTVNTYDYAYRTPKKMSKTPSVPSVPSPLSTPTTSISSTYPESTGSGSKSTSKGKLAGLAKKRSSGQLLVGLGKGLGRMGSVVRRTASEGTTSLSVSRAGPSNVKYEISSVGRRGWRSGKAKMPDIRAESPNRGGNVDRIPGDRVEAPDLGDAGIGLPFNVEHDLHVSPSLEDLPLEWLNELRQQGLTESDLMLIAAAKHKQSQNLANARTIGSPESGQHIGSYAYEHTEERYTSPERYEYQDDDEPPAGLRQRYAEEGQNHSTSADLLAPRKPDGRALKRLSDQLRTFSMLKLDEDGDDWTAGLLEAFAPSEEQSSSRPPPAAESRPLRLDTSSSASGRDSKTHDRTTKAKSTERFARRNDLSDSAPAKIHTLQARYTFGTGKTSDTLTPRLASPPKPTGPRSPSSSHAMRTTSGCSIPPSAFQRQEDISGTSNALQTHQSNHSLSSSSADSDLPTPSTSRTETFRVPPTITEASGLLDGISDTSKAKKNNEGNTKSMDLEEYEEDQTSLDVVEAMVADGSPLSPKSETVKVDLSKVISQDHKINQLHPFFDIRTFTPIPPRSPQTPETPQSKKLEDSAIRSPLHDPGIPLELPDSSLQGLNMGLTLPDPPSIDLEEQLARRSAAHISLPASATCSTASNSRSSTPHSDPMPPLPVYEKHPNNPNWIASLPDQGNLDMSNPASKVYSYIQSLPLVNMPSRGFESSRRDLSTRDSVDAGIRASMNSTISSEGSSMLHNSIHEATVQQAYVLTGLPDHPYDRPRQSTFGWLKDDQLQFQSAGPDPGMKWRRGHDSGYATSESGLSALDALDEAARRIADPNDEISEADGEGGMSGMFDDADEEEELRTPKKATS